jgi:glucan-binding YG repeat protein
MLYNYGIRERKRGIFMKNIKRRILGLVLTAGLLVGVGMPLQANAEWKQKNYGEWTYLENGVAKTGWLQDSGKWYYLDNSGLMKKGWIEDKGTWYYLMDSGALNDSKTTKSMPNEVKLVYDIVKPLAQSRNLKYYGLYRVKSDYHIQELQNKCLYFFENDDDYGIAMNFYIYDPTNGKVYFTSKDGIEVSVVSRNKTDYAIKKPVTKEQAIQNVKTYLSENQKNTSLKIEVEQSDDISKDNVFVAHCYEDMGDHTATSGWYYVDKSTGNVVKMQ